MSKRGDCPACGIGITTFCKSKHIGDGLHIRKRTCNGCGLIFCTQEEITMDPGVKRYIYGNENFEMYEAIKSGRRDLVDDLFLEKKIADWMRAEMKIHGFSPFLRSLITDAYYEEHGDE